MYGDISECQHWEWGMLIVFSGKRDAAKYPIIHRASPHSKELPTPKCQWIENLL